MRISSVLLGLLLLLCVACDKSEKETLSGLKFKVVKAGNGVLPKPNDVLVFNFKLMDSKDSVWMSTYENGIPGAIMIQDTAGMKMEDGMMQMLRMVSPGDSIVINYPVRKFYTELVKAPMPRNLDSTLNITYYLKIDSITTREAVMKMQTELMEKKTKEQLAKDTTAIDAFLAEKKIVAQRTASGIRYVITKPGVGENGKSGQTTKVNYAGYLLDGKYFDTSIKEVAQANGVYSPAREPYGPYEVTIDQSQVMQGWHEALKLLNKGAKATVYIPSGLAYGPQQRSEVIKPNSVLVFDLEIVELK